MTRLIRTNPLPGYSESGMLKEIGQLLRQVKTADDASHQIVKEIAFMVGLLASQARIGVHVNPPGQRVTEAELQALVNRLRQMTGYDYSLGFAYGGVRLEKDMGSIDVSPRLSKREMYEWLHAFLHGLQVGLGERTNPPSKAGRKFISKKIALLAHEGVPSPKRIAEAYGIARQRGFRGISLPRSSKSRRLRHNPAQLAVLGLNPPPRIDQSVDPIVALWGEFHYVRPDDPEGEVVRVHEFENGFVAVPLVDGRVLLESRRGERLWTAQ